MSLFDIFSSDAGTNAANLGYKRQKSGINNAISTVQDYTNEANDQLQTGAKNALGYLDTGTGQASNDYTLAQQLYAALQGQDQAGRTMYENSLGLNGAAGNQAALSAYQQSPGFGYALDQANQNVLRNGAATGNVASGNVLSALSDRAQQLQNQDYGNWQTQLSSFDPYRDVQGQAGIYSDLAGLQTGTAAAKAGIAGGLGTNLSNNYISLGDQIASQQRALGAAGYQNAQDVYGAQQSANGNVWNALLGIGGFATKFV